MRSQCFALPVVLALCTMVGCGGGSAPATPQQATIKVSVNPSAISVPAGSTTQFFASVTGTTQTAVTWQVNGTPGGDSTVGTIDATGTYLAPAVIPSPATVALTAVLQSDPTKSGSAQATVSLAMSPAVASLLIHGGTQQFSAAGTSGPITWTVGCVSPCNPSTIGTILPSGFYTAPDTLPDNVLLDPSLAAAQPQAFAISVTATPQSSPSTSASVYVSAGGPGLNQAFQNTPIMLGTSGGNAQDSSSGFCCSGTLGSLVTRNGTNFILSNAHVLARSGHANPGEQISHPGLVDTRCGTQSNIVVANYTQSVPLNHGGISLADAALAQVVNNQVDSAGAILALGTVNNGIAQPAPPANTLATPALNMFVAKSGRTSGLTCGEISDIDLSVAVDYENTCGSNSTFTVNYDHQIDIISTSFGAPGDSGSLVVNSQTAEPVGLLYAGSDTDTVANPIQAVLSALADPQNHVQPSFVGAATHPVEACVGIGPFNNSQSHNANSVLSLSAKVLAEASDAKSHNLSSLMKITGVIGVGVGSGERAGEAAVTIYVEKGKTPGAIPSRVDGVPTRVRVIRRFKALSESCPSSKGTFGGIPN